jgi:7-carboxy-7-deazaguanine synthase
MTMAYALKEIFFTLQGEGINAGRPAVFLRFSGCNLWSGRDADRGRGPGGCSRWCDTNFVGTDGSEGGKYATAFMVAQKVAALWPSRRGSRFVVCTGGEPLLQLDITLIDALHEVGFQVAIETNGTLVVPDGVDWVCVSPKAGSNCIVTKGNELKLVFPQEGIDPESFTQLSFDHFLLQPCDGPNGVEHTRRTLEYCLAHPWWRVGVQAHKVLGIR